ncbi:MAG: flagellin, partial [Aquificota bacterium]|nr:flagellin [Aquificota bacterium]
AGQIFNKLKEIYVKAQNAANDINDPNARAALQREINNLIDAIQKIATDTEYNGIRLLNGTFTNKYIHYGPRSGQVVSVSIPNLQASALGAYTMQGSGQANVQTAVGLSGWANADYVVDAGDSLTISSGSTSVTLTGADLGVTNPDFGGNRFVDAYTIAQAINGNSALQQAGISATASNDKVAAVAYGSGLAQLSGNGDIADVSITLKIYVGDTKVFEKTYSQTGVLVNGSTVAVGPDLDSLIQDINNSVLNGGQLTASKDDTGTKLRLTTSNGQTVLVQVDVSLTASNNDATAGESINLGIDLGKIVPHSNNLTVTDTEGGASATGTASGVSVGDLVVAGVDNFTITQSGIASLGLNPVQFENLYNIDVSTNSGAERALIITQTAIRKVDTVRSQIGAIMNNLQSIYDAQKVAMDNTNEAENVIRNVDFAKEMATFTTMQIRMQAGIAMLAQANALPQLVLQLLR